jgi:hypothetical protein
MEKEKKYNLSFTAFVENLALGDLDDQVRQPAPVNIQDMHASPFVGCPLQNLL